MTPGKAGGVAGNPTNRADFPERFWLISDSKPMRNSHYLHADMTWLNGWWIFDYYGTDGFRIQQSMQS